MSAYMILLFEGAIATSTLPTGGFGRPAVALVQCAPPSWVMNTPLPGPPLRSTHVCTSTCQAPATSVFGSAGSIARPEQPVCSSTNNTRCHVAPPSVVLNTPWSCSGDVRWPSAQTYTVFG